MQTARDLMHAPAPTVSPDLSARELYRFLTERGLDGACVVDGGELVGVVTSMDLVFRQKKVHLPSFFVFLDFFVPLGDPRQADEEIKKIAASRVGDLATRQLVTVDVATPIDEVATRMVEDHVTVLPVLDGGRLVGMVTKQDVLKATLG
jgi:CBS domain-containing protein